jgi:Uma2 family endonuclease
MVSAIIININNLSSEAFVAGYLDDVRYELIDGELIDLEPTGLHEQVAGLINRKLNLPWFIPMKGQKMYFLPSAFCLLPPALCLSSVKHIWR